MFRIIEDKVGSLYSVISTTLKFDLFDALMILKDLSISSKLSTKCWNFDDPWQFWCTNTIWMIDLQKAM